MATTDGDLEILSRFMSVGVPTIVDVLDDAFGLRAWMRHEIKPIFKQRIAGRAVTLVEVRLLEPQADPFEHLFDAVDACGDGDVLVIASGGDTELSNMGDLVAAGLQVRGAVGAVMDGAVRDIEPMIEMRFPVFAASVSPVNFAGKAAAIAHQVPITCGGVVVRPGDLVVADWDGVVVVPWELAAEVAERAVRAEARDAAIRARIRSAGGTMPLARIFAEFE